MSLAILTTFFLFFVQTLFLLLVFRFLPSTMPMFYSLPQGESQLAVKFWLWLIPGLTMFVLIFNLVLGKSLIQNSKILYKTLVLTGCAVALILTLTLFKIITT